MDEMVCEDVVKHDSEMSLNDYVGKMRQTNTMGGATEIKAYCLIFKKNVKVHSIPNNKIIDFTVDVSFPYVGLRWTGNHYDPI
jgi:hypothetical protein